METDMLVRLLYVSREIDNKTANLAETSLELQTNRTRYSTVSISYAA